MPSSSNWITSARQYILGKPGVFFPIKDWTREQINFPNDNSVDLKFKANFRATISKRKLIGKAVDSFSGGSSTDPVIRFQNKIAAFKTYYTEIIGPPINKSQVWQQNILFKAILTENQRTSGVNNKSDM